MKVLDIALKDMLQAFRSRTALVFMFVVPILVTAMFVFLFGGFGDEQDGGLDIPTISVQIVNLDEGEEKLGDLLVDGLQSEEISIPIDVTLAQDAESARRAVDFQDAGVAVIIPRNFSAAVTQPQGTAEVEIYQDPTLTLGPSIISGIVSAFIDGFSGAKIAVGVTMEQLSARGVFLNSSQIAAVVSDYTEASSGVDGVSNLLEVKSPSGSQDTDPISGAIQMVMAGMMVFYAFFTGVNMVNTVLREDEEGTLARLFTTPTPRHQVLYGKLLAACATVFIQVLVLLIFGRLVFEFDWGSPLRILLASLWIAITAGTFGVFFSSLIKSSRQAGAAMGIGLTVTGMIGMMRVFTVGVPNAPQPLLNLSYLVPQGWALNAVTNTMDRGSTGMFLTTLGALLAWSLAFLWLGVRRFRTRFA
jgi:ABC-2 type transport system permease protein